MFVADLFTDHFRLSIFVGGSVPMTEAVIPIAGNDMDVSMKDYLPRGTSVIDTNIDPVSFYRSFHNGRKFSDCFHQRDKVCGGNIVDVFGMLFGDHQCVPLIDGMNIKKGIGMLVLKDLFRRNFAGNDFAKETVIFHKFSLLYKRVWLYGSIGVMIKSATPHPLSIALLARRGITEPDAIERFLYPDYERDTHDPFGILNMDRAVDRILRALREGEKFVIYGDYDCDGIPGSVVLHDLFKKIGCSTFSNYIPHRHHEGYGLNNDAIAKFAKDGVGLIITVDCGITDVAQVQFANELGVDVIITDHHLPQAILPPAYAILNSKQEGDTYADNMLCGAGVAFKLAHAVLLKGKFTNIPAGWEKWLLDMAGLSTIADMVPLQNENRVLAYYGLKVLRRSARPGISALLSEAGVDQRYLTEEDVGFTIGPRINAASRMDVPFRAFELLSTRDPVFAKERAHFLAGLNDERKQEVARMTREAKRVLEKRTMREVIVIGNPSWRVGVAGIVANQLAETYDRPAFVWGKEGSTMMKGSCRSDGRVNIVELMIATREGVFTQKGGHEFSGGFTVSSDAIHFLEDALCDAHATVAKKQKESALPDADATLSLAEVNEETFAAVDALAPFGTGNQKPVFSFHNVLIEKVEQFGKTRNHLKLSLTDASGGRAQAIAFFASPTDYGDADISNGARITLLAHLEKSYFRSRPELRLRIVGMK